MLIVYYTVVIKLLKPKSITIEVSESPAETTPLLQSASGEQQSDSPTSTPAPKQSKEIHSPSFDLGLARISLLIDIVAYVLMGLSPTAMAFTGSSLLGSFGAGFSPAAQSVTTALYARRGGTEIGRLFGALSVIQALW